MCGIAGVTGPEGLDIVRRMAGAMLHRGPDGEGFHADAHVALGQRRLSIIDLGGGKQPIANEDGTLQLVCNGEIYNSPQLRAELTQLGHEFRTKTDVEVILHLYEEHGAACVKRLRGMFAFAIWDSVNRRLLLARDHLGQKPLFYAEAGGRLLFASEVKGLLASRLIPAEPELTAIWHYISLRYVPDDYSLFKGIKKLPAATTLMWQPSGVRTECYWRPEFEPKRGEREDVLVDELDDLLRETVRLHTLSDVRVGAFLSGGIDSSTVAAMMATQQSEPVPSFTIGVQEQQFNELPYARKVSAKYGMEAHERTVKADLVQLMPQMIHHMDEPADPFGVGVYLASALARETVKVVLSGDGGDENFAGYDRFVGQRLVDYYCLLPAWFRRSVMRKLIRRIPESFGYKSIAQKASWINEMSFFSRGERYAHSLCFLRFMPEAKERLFSARSRKLISGDDSTGKILEHFESDRASELVDRMLYTDLMTRLPDHLLALGDRMSMAHSLENRPVLVDYKVVEFAASLPSSLKLRGRTMKYLLKRVSARYLPPDLISRPKQGFSFPLATWMRGELRPFMTNLLRESRFVREGIFEPSYIEGIWAEHLAGRADHNYRLWILANLEFWYRLYFERESIESLREDTHRLMAA